MIRTYLNYPTSRISVHADPACRHFQDIAVTSGYRFTRIDPSTISNELQQFMQGAYRFASQAHFNDMRLEIDFGDSDFELAVLRHIHRILGKHYKPFYDSQIETHCP